MANTITAQNWDFVDSGLTNVVLYNGDGASKGGVAVLSSLGANTDGAAAGLVGQATFIRGSEPWYIAGRFGAKNLGTVNAHLSFGAVNNSAPGTAFGDAATFLTMARVEVGYIKTASATFWAAQFCDGAGNTQSLVSTVPLDTDMHDFELRYDGTNVSLIVDRGTAVTAVLAHSFTTYVVLGVFHVREIGVDGSPADQGIDKFLAMTGLPTTYSGPPS